MMVRKRWVFLAAALGCAAWWIWPYFGAYALASAAARQDVDTVAARVDFKAVRGSLARQVARAYLRQSGRGQAMGDWQRGLVIAAGASMADPYLANLLSPDSLTSILGEGRLRPISIEGRTISFDQPLPKMPDLFGRKSLSVFFDSYFDGPTSFVFHATEEGSNSGSYGVHMRLAGATWRLSGVDLPQSLLDKIVADMVAREKAERQS